jgi:hypothetical protein
MNEHAHPLSMAERADELEEAKMHEMERIITKSTIAHLMDGEIKMDTGPAMKARYPGKYFLIGDDPRLPPTPEKPRLVDYFPPPLCLDRASFTERITRAKGAGSRRRSCSHACCTTSRSSASSAATTATGARR